MKPITEYLKGSGIFLLSALFMSATMLTSVSAQVAVNADNSAADPSAMMDVKSSSMGMLMPRMTAAERSSIVSPANGLMVFQTDAPQGFYYFDGSVWQRLQETLIESDPVFSVWNKSTGISIFSDQVSDFNTAVAATPSVTANTAKRTYPSADATKLAGIQAGAEVNVNADWNAVSGDSFILNKTPVTPGMPLISPADASDLYFYDGTNWIAKTGMIGLSTGSNQPINNMQPYSCLNFVIALQGVFPSPNALDQFLSEIMIVSFGFAPKGWALCNGQLLPINQNQALFSLLGTTYGGNGQTNFALPNFQGRVPVHAGNGFTLGQMGGSRTITLIQQNIPNHSHPIVYQ